MIKPLFQRIIVAYNGSKSSLQAVLYSILMAKLYKCSIKIVYVVDIDSIRELTLIKFIIKEEGENIANGLQRDGERNLNYVTNLAKTKGVKIETELRRGAVWAEVIKASDDFKADLILLGASYKGNLSSTLKHDVVSVQNSEIIGSAHCSVMVVRQPYIEQLFKLS